MQHNRGYLIIAQDSQNIDYHRMAYALALSIKNSQSSVNQVCLATDRDIKTLPKTYKVFDKIVNIPWGDHAADAKWKINNKWKYYYMTPFDETVILDADMLFTSDISDWWDTLSQKNIFATSSPITYRGEVIVDNSYRKTFTNNELPNVHTAFMYFKKNETAAELFKLVETIFNNWELFFYEFLDETRPKFLSGDVAYALAMKILGIENECISNHSVPSFVHMKSKLQNIPHEYITDDWTLHIPTSYTKDGALKVGNYQQYLPFHYQIKEWLTDDILKKLEERYFQ